MPIAGEEEEESGRLWKILEKCQKVIIGKNKFLDKPGLIEYIKLRSL